MGQSTIIIESYYYSFNHAWENTLAWFTEDMHYNTMSYEKTQPHISDSDSDTHIFTLSKPYYLFHKHLHILAYSTYSNSHTYTHTFTQLHIIAYL